MMKLTVAYCRVSTEDQASEGHSIEGQAAKLAAYAKLHDLGEVLTITDPGASGKDTNRPGLERVRKNTHLALVCGQGKWEDAVTNIQRAIRLDPRSAID